MATITRARQPPLKSDLNVLFRAAFRWRLGFLLWRLTEQPTSTIPRLARLSAGGPGLRRDADASGDCRWRAVPDRPV
jgi:hypothetical protein